MKLRTTAIPNKGCATVVAQAQTKYGFTVNAVMQNCQTIALAFRGKETKNSTPMKQASDARSRSLGKTALPSCGSLSEFLEKSPDVNPQRFGDAHQRVHRNSLFTGFQFADKNGGKLGSLRQFFLAEFDLLPMLANGFAEHQSMFTNGRHARIQKQVALANSINYSLCFGLRFRWNGRKNGFIVKKVAVGPPMSKRFCDASWVTRQNTEIECAPGAASVA